MAKAKKSKAKKSQAKKSKTKKTKATKKSKKTARAAKTNVKAKKSKKTARKAAKKAAAKKPAPRKAAKKAPKQIVGEGDYAASRSFLKDQAGFVKRNEDKIPAMGKEAEAALEGPEGASLRAAEDEARARSRE